MSNAWSATNRFRRRFSSSSSLSRLASFTSIPPYFLFHRSYVCSVIWCGRHASLIFSPLFSTSPRIRMICSTLCFLFIVVLRLDRRTNSHGAGMKPERLSPEWKNSPGKAWRGFGGWLSGTPTKSGRPMRRHAE